MNASCRYVVLIVSTVSLFFFASKALSYPALYYRFRQLSVGPSDCLYYAKNAINQVGLQNVGSDRFGSGGNTNSARTFITCIRLPKSGACGGDGSMVMFVAASDLSGDDANALLARLDEKFGNPQLIDCNQ